jgi:hypothetical protein
MKTRPKQLLGYLRLVALPGQTLALDRAPPVGQSVSQREREREREREAVRKRGRERGRIWMLYFKQE